MKIGIILGTRPEIIKLSSIIKLCENQQWTYFVIHSNQHYSFNLDKIFFTNLNLPNPKYNLHIGSGNHGEQTGKMLQKVENILIQENPDVLLVQGDTNTTLAGALAAAKLGIKVAHIEAGLRSYDRAMPEETNRIIADHISDFLFCPTQKQKTILLSEGIAEDKIFITGNTIVDAVLSAAKIEFADFLAKNNLISKKYILATMHRPENVDDFVTLKKQISNISRFGLSSEMEVLFPIHPRTLCNFKKFNLIKPQNIRIVNPVDFTKMIYLEKNAKIILTDSGGVQEEACILGVPSLTIRKTTDRPECVEIGASKIVGSDFSLFQSGYSDYFNGKQCWQWKNPFGSGNSGEKILKILKEIL